MKNTEKDDEGMVLQGFILILISMIVPAVMSYLNH